MINSGAKAFFKAFCMVAFACSSKLSTLDFVEKPIPEPKSFKSRAPMLDVIMIIVFLKSTLLPKPSVKIPSSRTCNNKLNTSGWAFSISSNKTTE